MKMANQKENQKIEFKESWREEHLRGICAFANSHGGIFYIGKNDAGKITGLPNCKKLLEDIPNQIKNNLGILADVNAKKEKGLECITIKVKSSKSPVSFKGKCYIRSGSTTQELNGSALTSFLLEKNNMTWESVVEAEATIKDLDPHSIEKFRERARQRFPEASNEKSDIQLLEKLHLVKGQKLTRAGILLFGKNPQKHFPAAVIKIARFKDDETLQNMDEVKGNLFQQTNEALVILKNKYLTIDVKIEGLYREDQLEIPESALREAVVNAVVHKDYSEAESQIRVYNDYISIWNFGELNHKLSVDKLKKKHPSFPRNNLIADVFFKAGLIEKWGSGTLKIINECSKAGLPDPIFEELTGGLQLTFLKSQYNSEYYKRWGLSERQIKAVTHVKEFGKITNSEFQKITGASKRTASTDLQSLMEKGLLLQIGATGKGTQYVLPRGSKGAIGAKSPALRKADELDVRIDQLMNELQQISPNDEVRWHMNTDVFFKIFDLWLEELLLAIIPVAQKFNQLFTEPKHHIFIINGIGQVSFTNEKPAQILKVLKENCRQFKSPVYEATININLNFGTFRKGGLKTFHCHYGIEIKLETIRYKILMDQFTENNARAQVLQAENLLHKPLSRQHMKNIYKQLGETIFKHIDYNTKKEGLR